MYVSSLFCLPCWMPQMAAAAVPLAPLPSPQAPALHRLTATTPLAWPAPMCAARVSVVTLLAASVRSTGVPYCTHQRAAWRNHKCGARCHPYIAVLVCCTTVAGFGLTPWRLAVELALYQPVHFKAAAQLCTATPPVTPRATSTSEPMVALARRSGAPLHCNAPPVDKSHCCGHRDCCWYRW